GGIMSGLRAVSAIFAASAGLDAEQAAALNFFPTPMLQMNSAALRNQIEQRLMIKVFEFSENHRVVAMLIRNRKSEIGNLVNPLAAFGNEDRQFFHHELGFAKRANHVCASGRAPFLRHLLAGVAAPALDVSVACKNTTIDFCRVVFVQPGFTSAIDVVAVVKHETRAV